MEKNMVVEMLQSGMSMGLMSCLVSFGTVTLQTAINTLGTSVIVAHTAARKVFEIICLPSSVLSSAMATFSGQNYGAKKYGRIKSGLKASLFLAFVWCGIAFLLAHTVSDKLIAFMASTSDAEILYWGSTYLKVELSFYAVCAIIVILRNTMQGFGERIIPVFPVLLNWWERLSSPFALSPCLVIGESSGQNLSSGLQWSFHSL
ncbi:MAG: MATE family efflux transporter [Eubacterium sp.]